MTTFIDAQRTTFGVEPICRVLEIAPSSYYAARVRPPSARAISDAALSTEISRIHAGNYAVYGARKLWHALRREGTEVGRDHVARLMGVLGLHGAVRGKVKRTTVSSELSPRPADLVEREFSAPAPNRLWVADLTYVSTWSGFCYTGFVIDAFSRRIVGWRVSSSLRAELALDALEMAIWSRRSADLGGLVHHSDRGVQGPLDPLHRAPRRRGSRHLGGEPGRQLRQRPRRERQRPLQDRAHPGPGSLADGRPGRARDRGLGRLVERRASPLRLRRHPSGRVRGRLPFPPTGDRGRVKPNHPGLHETQGGSLHETQGGSVHGDVRLIARVLHVLQSVDKQARGHLDLNTCEKCDLRDCQL